MKALLFVVQVGLWFLFANILHESVWVELAAAVIAMVACLVSFSTQDWR